MIHLTLPYPPQANHMYTVVRGRKIKSQAYRTWSLSAELLIRLQHPGSIQGHYDIEITVPRPDRRGRDIDNLIKPISDAIAAAGVVQNDNLAMRVSIGWEDIEPSKGDVRVVIKPYGR